MPAYASLNRRDDKQHVPSPTTPAVTGIEYPSTDFSTTQVEQPTRGLGFYTHPNIGGSTIDDVEPPIDSLSLDKIWGTIRQEKERKMAKERPKVQSLEEVVVASPPPEQQHHRYYGSSDQQGGPPMQVIPVMESPPHSVPNPKSSPRKQKSISNFRESTDGRAMVATFDLPGEVAKQDIHISFQRSKLVLTWETAEISEWEDEDGVVLREQVRKMFHRTLPLPDGTKFDEIHAQMTSRGLIVRYPNSRCTRVDARSRSGDS